MRRLLIIANPAASGFTGAALRSVKQEFSTAYDVDTAWPTSAAGSQEAAAAAAAEGYDVVAAMGGDGVAHHVGNGLIHTDTALAVIPAGTTNVVARIMGLPKRSDKAAAALVDGTDGPVTVVHVTNGDFSHYALFALGVGFDADMVRDSERRPLAKGTLGSLHYVRSTLSVAIRDYRSKAATLRVTCDGSRVDAVSVMVQVHSPYTYFGPVALHLSKETSTGPIAFAAEELPVHKAASIALRSAIRRDVGGEPGVEVWPGFSKLIVEAEPEAPYQADGDFLGTGDYFEITPAPGALRMLLPSSRESTS